MSDVKQSSAFSDSAKLERYCTVCGKTHTADMEDVPKDFKKLDDLRQIWVCDEHQDDDKAYYECGRCGDRAHTQHGEYTSRHLAIGMPICRKCKIREVSIMVGVAKEKIKYLPYGGHGKEFADAVESIMLQLDELPSKIK